MFRSQPTRPAEGQEGTIMKLHHVLLTFAAVMAVSLGCKEKAQDPSVQQSQSESAQPAPKVVDEKDWIRGFELTHVKDKAFPLVIWKDPLGVLLPPDEYEAQAKKAWPPFWNLIKDNPSNEVSEGLRKLIEERKVLVLMKIGHSDLNVAGFQQSNVDGEKVWLLIFDPVMTYEQQLTVEMMKLVVFHEYQHYKQMSSRDHSPSSTGDDWTDQDYATWFNDEIAAYTAECKLAVKLNWQDQVNVCQVYAKEGFGGMVSWLGNTYVHYEASKGRTALLARLINDTRRAGEG